MPTNDELYAARDEAQRRLAGLPGLMGVAIGPKYVGGRSTGEPALVVYVERKLPRGDVSPDQSIPPDIDGIATDVEESAPVEYDLAEEDVWFDDKSYRPVRGGTRLALTPFDDGGAIKRGFGTLGCMAETTPGGKRVALTNWHVLHDEPKLQEDEVGQPTSDDGCSGCCSDIIGKRVSGQTWHTTYDGAYVLMDDDVESEATIAGIGSVKGSRRLEPEEVIFEGFRVRKRGAKTGPTEGVVRSVVYPAIAPRGQMSNQIQVWAPEGERFSESGDSGSVIVGDDNVVVGLLWGSSSVPSGKHFSVCSPIEVVEDALGVKVTKNPPVATHVDRAVPSPVAASRKLEHDLAATAVGRTWLELFGAHRGEVVELIEHDRRMTLAWHRNSGPAILHHAWSAVYDGTARMPRDLDGQALSVAVQRILEALHDRGSDDLRRAIVAIEPLLAGLDGLTYAQLLARIDVLAHERTVHAVR